MNRYFSILTLFWSTSLAGELEYRANFVLACVTSIGNLAGSIFAVWIFYDKLALLGGYNFDEAMIILGFFIFLDGVANTVMRQNLSRIVQHVRMGTLDFILLKPLDTQFWLSSRNCSPWGLPNICFGLGLIFYGGTRSGFAVENYLMGIVPLMFGLVMLYSLWFILGSTSIWFVKVSNITHVLYQLLEAGRFPVTAYPPLYKIFFTFVIPVGFLTTFPAEMMIGRPDFEQLVGQNRWTLLFIAGVMAATLLMISRMWWRFALRYYTSASS